jgi:spore coat protein A, manganese oxidase
VKRIQRAIFAAAVAGAVAWASSASAQQFTAFPTQNPLGPTGAAYQTNYPYPGQCVADSTQAALFPGLPPCSTVAGSSSFACDGSSSNRTAGGWAACSTVSPFKTLAPVIPNSAPPPGTVATPRFVWEMLNPPDYAPDRTTFPNADYYEIILHEAWGFQAAAGLDLFPDPTVGVCSITGAYCDAVSLPPGCGACNPVFPGAPPVPNGMQWTGLTCNSPGGCSCPADLAAGAFKSAYCNVGGATASASPAGRVPYGYPLYTPIWGVGSRLNGLTLPGTATSWSANDFLATWPSISIRANRGTPVVVKWVNEFPNTHVLCPYPDAADWPCAIDRTFMGVKARMDPAALQGMTLNYAPLKADGVNVFGSPQQPDNSWVTHLHGGEIPPSTDGFAEKWFGNRNSAKTYNVGDKLVTPAFESVSGVELRRPNGNSDTYTYPMDQEEATIWFHDHTLGKTHHNVIAGPAGFFPVKEPLKHGKVVAGACMASPGASCDYTWVDPVTEPRTSATSLNLQIPTYDLFMAVQDRAFNDDGSINFSNGLGQTFAPVVAGQTSITNGVNPLVHPTWVPEYFGDHALVNGVLWPKKSVEPGWYRMRLVDGSDSRCYTFGFQVGAMPAPGAAVTFQVPFYVIASDQGYYQKPVKAVQNRLTMCPGERYEILVNFGALPTVAVNTGTLQPNPSTVWLVNNAPAPFPAGFSPQAAGGQPELNVLMRFDVNPAFGPGVKSCGATVKVGKALVPVAPASLSWDPANVAANLTRSAGAVGGPPAGFYDQICMPADPTLLPANPNFVDIRPAVTVANGQPLAFPAGTIVRQVYLNERVDGTTAAPLGMQLNGVPFEYKVTETPKLGSREVWQFINLTVDAHPMHPHLVRHLTVARQKFNVGAYKRALCGSTTCQPGTSPGGEMQVIPDVNQVVGGVPTFMSGAVTLVNGTSNDSGYKDVTRVMPGEVTTIVADWKPRWNASGSPNAPGTAGCPNGTGGCSAPYVYESATSGPYVWHCHINSHEDSEMMRTSLVVP